MRAYWIMYFITDSYSIMVQAPDHDVIQIVILIATSAINRYFVMSQ